MDFNIDKVLLYNILLLLMVGVGRGSILGKSLTER